MLVLLWTKKHEIYKAAIFEIGTQKIWLERDVISVSRWIRGEVDARVHAHGHVQDVSDWTKVLTRS